MRRSTRSARVSSPSIASKKFGLSKGKRERRNSERLRSRALLRRTEKERGSCGRSGVAIRYIRLREPPYSDADLVALAAKLAAPAFVYFRHEDAPTAPAYAERLRQLLSAARPPG